MNNLSWIIYGVGVVSNTKAAMGFMIFLSGVGGIIGAFLAVITIAAAIDSKQIEYAKSLLGFFKKLFVVFLVLIMINIVIPTHETLILIASSQYGEMVLNNPKVNEIVDPSIDLLKTWIEKEKKQLNQENSK